VRQGQHRPVEHDADQNDRDHNKRALRRDLGAGQHQIKRSHDQGAEGRPFLDRHAVGEAGDQRQQRAQNEEHDAGDHRHVIAGDRKNVADAGDEHGVVEVRRDRVALAGDQGRRDRPDVARQHGADASVDRIAELSTNVTARSRQPASTGGVTTFTCHARSRTRRCAGNKGRARNRNFPAATAAAAG
jgi:hypothetical protein